MKLWLISQDINNDYDTYDSAVVAAETEERAQQMHPDSGTEWSGDEWFCARIDGTRYAPYGWGGWAPHPQHVSVRLVGEAKPGTEPGVICASFNAG